MAAYNAIPATGGTLYFPPGTYRLNTLPTFTVSATKPLQLLGVGPSSILAPAAAAGDGITVTGDGSARFGIAQLAIVPAVTRNASTYNLVLSNLTRVLVDRVTIDGTGGGLKLNACVFFTLNGFQCDSTDGSTRGETCLRIINSTGNATNVQLRTGSGVTGYTNCRPPLHITGANTELAFSSSSFQGAGSHSQYTVSSVASDAAKFTVTTSATHDFRVGDFVVLRGMTPAGYNSMWRVATVPTGTTFTVTSTLNPGSSSVNGTAESVAAAALITNEDSGSASSVNESRFANCIFEAIQTGLYGSAGLYFDGRRGNATQSGTLSGWNLTGCYYDQYATGLLLSGMASNAANETTANGFSVAGGVSNARGRAVHIDQVQGVTVDGFVGCVPGSVTPIDDGISNSAGLYVYAGPGAPFTQGVTVGDSQFGPGRNYQSTNNTPYKYGVLLDGASIDDVVVTGNILIGTTAPVGTINSALADARRWKIRSNESSAVFPPTAAALIPSVASATSITLAAGYDTVKITGTTDIATINGGWVGREVFLIHTGALNYQTGGNLAILVARAAAVGHTFALVFDGTSWYTK